MIHRDVAKETVTIYNYFKVGNSFTYRKTVLKDCVWKFDESAQNTDRGLKIPSPVKLIIPYSYEYIGSRPGCDYLGVGWTISIMPEIAGTYILQGKVDYNFPMTPPDKNIMVSDIIIPFEKTYNPRRALSLLENFMGSRWTWTVEVDC